MNRPAWRNLPGTRASLLQNLKVKDGLLENQIPCVGVTDRPHFSKKNPQLNSSQYYREHPLRLPTTKNDRIPHFPLGTQCKR